MIDERDSAIIIIRARNMGLDYPQIGHLLGKTADAVRMHYNLKKNERELGVKPIIRKKDSRATLKRHLSSVLAANPIISLDRIHGALIEDGMVESDIPKRTTIYNTMKDLKYERYKATKRNFISLSSQQKIQHSHRHNVGMPKIGRRQTVDERCFPVCGE